MRALKISAVLLLAALFFVAALVIPWWVDFRHQMGGNVPEATPKAILEMLVKHQVEELKFTLNTAIVNADDPSEFKFDVKDALNVVEEIEQRLREVQKRTK